MLARAFQKTVAFFGGNAYGGQEKRRKDDGPALSAHEEMDDKARQLAFTFATIALAAKLAATDGSATEEEFIAFRQIFPLQGEDDSRIRELFFMAEGDPNPFSHYAKQLARLFNDRAPLGQDMLRRFCRFAEADGRATVEERRMLERIAVIFGVSVSLVNESLTSDFKRSTTTNPFALIGVTTAASNDEIKQAYRNKVRELHPDRLMAEGYSKEDIDEAQAELMAVNEAYVTLSRQRKIK